MVRKENYKELLLAAVPKKYRALLTKVIAVAERNYSQVIRLSGEPLINHVLRAAKYYAELRIDFNGVVATVLHHRLPDTEYEDKEIFNDDVLNLLKKVEEVFSNAKKESVDTQVIYKYILSFDDDIRVVLIKLSEKFDNARTIDLLPEEKKRDVARRLLKIYAPLAEYMNLADAKNEFELHGFRVLYPSAYQEVANFIHNRQVDVYQKIEEIKKVLQEILGIVEVEGQIWGRVKNYYSIWRKLSKHETEGKKVDIAAFNDILAFTVMVDKVDQCYSVAYALKDYADVPDEYFEDYIQTPKPNGFSEIQVVCQFPELVTMNVEVQVLTNEMYWHNTYGPASHIAYKLTGKRFAKQSTEFQWIETLQKEIEQSKLNNDLQLSNPMRPHLFQDKIFTFTPKHRVVELAKGSTGIDFAYQVHTRVGDCASFVTVNGKTMPLSTELHNGDVVDVQTDARKLYPSDWWLEFAKTKSAQVKIRRGLRKKILDEAK